MSSTCKVYGTSITSREQESYHWDGKYIHQYENFQIWMAASRPFYDPWICTREGQGCTIMSLSKERDIKYSSRKERWNIKVATLKGNPSISGIVELSLYDSKPFYFMSNACEVVKCNKMTHKVWSKESNRMVKIPFFRLNIIHDYNIVWMQ